MQGTDGHEGRRRASNTAFEPGHAQVTAGRANLRRPMTFAPGLQGYGPCSKSQRGGPMYEDRCPSPLGCRGSGCNDIFLIEWELRNEKMQGTDGHVAVLLLLLWCHGSLAVRVQP